MDFEKILNKFEFSINQAFNFFEAHLSITLFILFLFAFAIRLFLTPFEVVLREDSYYYLLKSLKITQGDFTPSQTQANGWPLFMAPFFFFFKSSSIFQNMIYAYIISDLIGALSIFPLAYIGKKIFNIKSLIILLLLFSTSFHLVESSSSVYSEPLFTFLLLLVICFIYKAKDNQNYILIASIIGAFSYYVRPNGIIILPIIIFSFFLMRKQIPNFNYKYLIYIVIVFLIISFPFLYQRYAYFSSPFSYGENSKYFVDTYEQVWSSNIQAPSIVDYFRTHTLKDYINRFMIHGFFAIIQVYAYQIFSPLLLFFFLFGAIRNLNNENFVPLFVLLSIWILSLIPIYQIFGNERHLYITIPFIFIIITTAVMDVVIKNKYQNVLLIIFFIVIFITIIPPTYSYMDSRSIEKDGMEWGRWAAQNIQGKIAIIEGGDLIELSLPKPNLDNSDQFDPNMQQLNLETIRPDMFENLSSAFKNFKETNVTHLAIDDANINRRPYLKEIYSRKEIPSYLIEIYSNYNTTSKWKIKFYYINWSDYESLK